MTTRTIVCGVDGSPGGRAAVRVAASLAAEVGARLVAVHVLDRLMAVSQTAERVAATVLYDEVPDAGAEARGEVGDVAERVAAVAQDEAAAMIILGARSRGRSRTFLRAGRAAELAELTNIPVVVAPLQFAPAPAALKAAVHEAAGRWPRLPMSRAAAAPRLSSARRAEYANEADLHR